MNSKLSRLSSRNHNISYQLAEDKTSAIVQLNEKDRLKVPNKDFVLYFRDEMENKPTAFYSYSKDINETVCMINIMPCFCEAEGEKKYLEYKKKFP